MRSFQLFAAAVAATLGLGACTVSADGDHAEADATDKAANSARATDGNEGTTIRIGREGARADIDGSEIKIGRDGIDVDLGGREVEARIRADENGSVSLTTNRH
ncbi:MAG: hypothetical protein ACXWU1_00730 [Allosphingosinicella sp.]